MEKSLKKVPKYPASTGQKDRGLISGDPTRAGAVERGVVGSEGGPSRSSFNPPVKGLSAQGNSSRDSSIGVASQASVDEPTATGMNDSNFFRKPVYSMQNHNDERKFVRVWVANDCKNTSPCGVRRCQTCKFICSEAIISSSITGRKYTPSVKADCKTKNVVYLVFCTACNFQYVGETSQEVRERFSQHKASVRHNKLRTLLVTHFNSTGHSHENMQICVLEQIVDDDKKRCKSKLIQAEDFWIRTFVTAYPFGLNDKIKNYGCATNIFDPTSFKNAPYFDAKLPRRNRGHGRPRRAKKKRKNENFQAELEGILKDVNKPIGIRSLVVYLRKQTNTTLTECNQIIRDSSSNLSKFVRIIMLAFLSGYFVHRISKGDNKKPKYRLPVDFVSKGTELIGLQNIFADKKLKKLIVENTTGEVKDVSVVFKYGEPYSRSLFNYSKVLNKLSISSLHELEKVCKCEHSPYLYAPAGHIVTGDLNIVKCKELREIFSKGAKYRLPTPIDWSEVEMSAIKAIGTYVRYLSKKHKINADVIAQFYDRFMLLVRSRISDRQRKGIGFEIKSPFAGIEKKIKSELRKLHTNLIIVPADKCAGNYVFVCKFYYIKVLCDELGVTVSQNDVQVLGNQTYQPVNVDEGTIINRHCSMSVDFGLDVSQKDKCLPKLFATAKLHKSPYAWRFIAGARNSSTKPLCVRLHVILSHFERHFKNYCKTIEHNSGLSYFWSVKNSLEVKDCLMAKSATSSVQEIITADFSTLFTTLPHNSIKECLFALTDLCFKNSGSTLIAVEGQKVRYVRNPEEETGYCYRIEEVKDMICNVIDETFVAFAGKTFRQSKGVSMGGACSPLMASLTLSMMEYNYAKSKRTSPQEIPWCKRYIDDIVCVNCPNFMQIAQSIYPPELPLKRTNESLDAAAFLDMSLKLQNGECMVSLYNKTDDFNFPVIRYGFNDSNVHSCVGLGTWYGELIRITRITDTTRDYERCVMNLFHTLILHNFDRERLISKFCSYAHNCRASILKFGICHDSDVVSFVDRVLRR